MHNSLSHIHTHTSHTHTHTHIHPPPPPPHTHTGGDDEKVLLWRVDDIVRGKCQNVPMEAPHTSNIFAATFSCDNAYIYSGGWSIQFCSFSQ